MTNQRAQVTSSQKAQAKPCVITYYLKSFVLHGVKPAATNYTITILFVCFALHAVRKSVTCGFSKMLRLYFLISFLFILCTEPSFSAFEGENDFIIHPTSTVYSFLPSDYLLKKKFIFTTSGSRLYSMPECNKIHTGLLSAFPFALFGVDVSFFGSELYNETELGLSILKGTKNLFGIRMKIMKLGIKGYGSRFYWGNDLLFLSQNKLFYFQSIYTNALSYGYRYDEEKPISSFSSFLRIYPGEWNSFNIKITFSVLTGTNFEIGNGVKLSNTLSVGGGFDIETRSISSNLLLSLSSTDLTYSISSHPELGLTHTIGLIFSQVKESRE
ncbi:MAG: hypothetical protein E3J41_00440 [Candidatus Cloacimonadota bacterium]|nr:MAG: hypothetical protein E3J41_00440 [Candidatus Cloacimonadota bacterium]